jgi:hypothetical protein
MSSSLISVPASPGHIEELRTRHGVRALKPEEEGTAIARLPPGVYGFTQAPNQSEVPVFARKSYHSFEVHKAADGTEYVIGFVTPAEALDLESAKTGAAIRLFPDRWEGSQTLVSASMQRIVPPKRMPREDGNPFPFTIA